MAVINRDDPFDRQTAALRAGLSGADTANYTAILATTGLRTYGRGTVYLQGRFSVSGANCVARLIYVWNDGVTNIVKGQSGDIVLTASTTRVTVSGAYASDTVPVPGEGAYSVYVQLVSISSGNVDIWVGTENG
jgi:hypothetical protein